MASDTGDLPAMPDTALAPEPVPASDAMVAITLTGGRVAGSFRSALFSAAARAGVSVNEFVLGAAGEKLARTGSRFSSVFGADAYSSVSRPNPYEEGSSHRVALELTGWVPECLRIAMNKARGDRSLFEYAVECMRADIEARA